MNNSIDIDYDAKTKRLVLHAPFHLVDICRSFPSRRFEPKSKTWRVPLVRPNINHFSSIRGIQLNWKQEASDAMRDFEKLLAGPKYVAFPQELATHLMKKPPMEHQWPMLDKGWGLNAYALFAAMGTGKTYTEVLVSLARWYNKDIDRLMIICPATLRRTWEKEFKKYAKGDFVDFRFHDSADKSMAGWAQAPNKRLKVLAVSVEGLGISEKLFDSACAFFIGGGASSMVIADESSRIKNPDAKRTQRSITLAASARFKVILNGTPIAKGIQDLWAQYEFLDPNIIGSGDYWAFKTRYVVMGGFEGKQIVGYQNVQELMDLVTPYSLEVNKRLLNLPPKVPKTVHVEAAPEQKALFKKILTGIGEGHISVKNVLERMLRCQQVIGGFEPVTDIETDITVTKPLPSNPKLKALLEFIDDNWTDSKFVVWARYVPEIELLLSRLREKYGREAVVDYYGGTSDDDRRTAEDRYCNDPTCRILVGNPQAAGLGLTFIGGENDIMLYYSGTFAYIDRMQSEDRCHRIGQKNSVPVVDFVMEKTLDEAIIASIAEKKDMDDFVKDWIAKGGSVEELFGG